MMSIHRPLAPVRRRYAGHPADPRSFAVGRSAFRGWSAPLFLMLICTPVTALVVLGGSPSAVTFDRVAWIFAAYFAVAWLLLLGVIVRPRHVSTPMLIAVTAIALATQVPLAIALEITLHARTGSLAASVFTVGVPEELAKALPVLVVALLYWRRRWAMQPRDYLFLGAVSGLAFGAAEVVHYFTVNAVAEFYRTVQASIPSIDTLLRTGHSPSAALFDVLIGPMRYFIIDFVWRFLTDPISHACWAGLTGYFIGLAVTRRRPWFLVAWVGLASAATLHGLNDWGRVNGGPLWIAVTVVGGLLFLVCARAGSRSDRQAVADASPAVLAGHRPCGQTSGRPEHGITAGR